jgi:hypothetical protein
MKPLKAFAILAILAVAATMGLQRLGWTQAGSNLRILAPGNGTKITTSFVEVRYELINPAMSGSPAPTFQLQLDGGDPVRTTDTSYTFTGLSPGTHTVMIQLVDANNTPVAGGTNVVQFIVLQTPVPKADLSPGLMLNSATRLETIRASALPVGSAAQGSESLPTSSSPLPLLSIVGFGVLLGGIVSALRSR